MGGLPLPKEGCHGLHGAMSGLQALGPAAPNSQGASLLGAMGTSPMGWLATCYLTTRTYFSRIDFPPLRSKGGEWVSRIPHENLEEVP